MLEFWRIYALLVFARLHGRQVFLFVLVCSARTPCGTPLTNKCSLRSQTRSQQEITRRLMEIARAEGDKTHWYVRVRAECVEVVSE